MDCPPVQTTCQVVMLGLGGGGGAAAAASARRGSSSISRLESQKPAELGNS